MANELQQARYDQLIRRVGVLYGGGAKVTEVLSELFPVIDVENVPGELLWLSGWRLALGGTSETAGALLKPRIQLFNPVGSGKIMAVTKVIVSHLTNQTTMVMGITDTPLANNLAEPLIRDLRTGVSRTPVGQILQESLAAPLSPINMTFRLLGNTPYDVTDRNEVAILTEGSGITFALLIDQLFMDATFFWRERTIEPSESLF